MYKYKNENNSLKIICETENKTNDDTTEKYIVNFTLALIYLSDIIRTNTIKFDDLNELMKCKFSNIGCNITGDINNNIKRGILIDCGNNKQIIIFFKKLGGINTADLLANTIITDLAHMHYYNTMSNLSYDDKFYCDDKFYGKIAYNYTVKVPTVFVFNILKGI